MTDARISYDEQLAAYRENAVITGTATDYYAKRISGLTLKGRPISLLSGSELVEDACITTKLGLLGAELYLGSQIDVKTIPIAGRFALVEFPVSGKPIGLNRKLQQLLDQGLEPVIAHVERYPWLKPQSETFQMFKDMGAWIQVNVSGIENRTAMPYIQRDLVDIIADDNHGDRSLPKRLRACLDAYPGICARMESMGL